MSNHILCAIHMSTRRASPSSCRIRVSLPIFLGAPVAPEAKAFMHRSISCISCRCRKDTVRSCRSLALPWIWEGNPPRLSLEPAAAWAVFFARSSWKHAHHPISATVSSTRRRCGLSASLARMRSLPLTGDLVCIRLLIAASQALELLLFLLLLAPVLFRPQHQASCSGRCLSLHDQQWMKLPADRRPGSAHSLH